MTGDDVDHFLVAGARQISYWSIESFLFDVGNFFERQIGLRAPCLFTDQGGLVDGGFVAFARALGSSLGGRRLIGFGLAAVMYTRCRGENDADHLWLQS